MSSLENIIEAVLNPESGKPTGQSLIVNTHLSQMKMFGVRGGVEFMPAQDDRFDSRHKFIQNICKINKLDIYLDRIWDLFLCKGKILFYLRPTRDGSYKLYFYDKDQFRDYYDANGDLSEVIIRYSYKERTNFEGVSNLKWVRLKITSEVIEQYTSDAQPSFEGDFNSLINVTRTENTLKFIPCVVCKNKPRGEGQEGIGEFEEMRDQIENHEEMSMMMSDNLKFFGSPTLVSTRTPSELTEAIEGSSENLSRSRTMTSAGGWYSQHTGRAPDNDGRWGRQSLRKSMTIRKVIGNVAADERFGYIAPDPVSPDHSQYFRQNREEIHFAMGGIDELGMSANATAYEMKVIYGKVSTTAKKKAEILYTHGLGKLFEMALAAEEDLFKQGVAMALKMTPDQVTEQFVSQLQEKGKLPVGVFGLPPLGSREIRWRWTGPVFEESADDQQRKSIVARNMQELGVRSMEALKFFFDDKTEKELEGMLEGGVGFRYFNAIASSLQQVLGMYGQMSQMPDPGNPNQLLASAVPFSPLIGRLTEVLYNELNYGQQYEPVAPGDVPEYNTGRSLPAAGIPNGALLPGSGSLPVLPPGSSPPTNSGSFPNSPLPISPASAAGINFNIEDFIRRQQQLPMGGSIQQAGLSPEYAVGIPEPGSTISTQPSPSWGIRPEPGIPQLNLSGSTIPPDLATTAGQPGSVWQQLFPTFSQLLPGSTKGRRTGNKR